MGDNCSFHTVVSTMLGSGEPWNMAKLLPCIAHAIVVNQRSSGRGSPAPLFYYDEWYVGAEAVVNVYSVDSATWHLQPAGNLVDSARFIASVKLASHCELKYK
ncbi:hypothetical protein ACJJTC_017677 [Scirpophaga incertulas]